MEFRWFELDLNPEPWAIGPVGYARRGGRPSAYVGRNQQLHMFKEAVKEELGAVAQILSQEPIQMIEGDVAMVIYLWRQRAEYSTPQARTHRKHEADTTNMQKAIEDACQGILFKNDKDVKDIHTIQVAQGPDVRGKIVIGVAAWDRSSLPAHILDWPNTDA